MTTRAIRTLRAIPLARVGAVAESGRWSQKNAMGDGRRVRSMFEESTARTMSNRPQSIFPFADPTANDGRPIARRRLHYGASVPDRCSGHGLLGERSRHPIVLASKPTRERSAAASLRFAFTLLAVLQGWLLGIPRVSSAELTPASVNRAIDQGIAYIESSQNDRGGWDEYGGYSCGQSALCTLALAQSGRKIGDDSIRSAMRYLRSHRPQETYSVALQTLVFCYFNQAQDRAAVAQNVRFLEATQRPRGDWGYGATRGSGDPSNAQFAILALGAARDAGFDVAPEVFEKASRYWSDVQNRDGGWRYRSDGPSTGSMTCAGVASLLITSNQLSGSASVDDGQIVCCRDDTVGDAIGRGLQWLSQRFSTRANPGGHMGTHLYYLYAMERVGRLSGQRFLGQHDWYREGATQLLQMQDEFQGFWRGSGPLEPPLVATSFAVLFLSKGRRPVVVGRLNYDDDPRRWRKHRGSLRGLVREVEKSWRRELTHQTITLDRASLDDLLQTPVIVISGDRELEFAPERVDLLGEYLQQGGTIIFDADSTTPVATTLGEVGSNLASSEPFRRDTEAPKTALIGCVDGGRFTQSAAELCRRWFPDVAIEPLPPDHSVLRSGEVDPATLDTRDWPWGVQACCRTPVFFSGRSFGCRWSLADRVGQAAGTSTGVRDSVGSAIAIGKGILEYATGRQLEDKLQSRVVLRSGRFDDLRRGQIAIGVLELGAGERGAARAVPHAVTVLQSALSLPLRAVAEPVGLRSDAGNGVASGPLDDIGLLWIHGREDFRWSESEREAVADYLGNGGWILASAICGNVRFTEAFRREIASVLERVEDASALKPVGPESDLLRVAGGYSLSDVTIRRPGDEGLDQVRGRPILETAKIEGLTAVVFSPLDLSCGLESPNSVACPGYPTEDAVRIVANVILHALGE